MNIGPEFVAFETVGASSRWVTGQNKISKYKDDFSKVLPIIVMELLPIAGIGLVLIELFQWLILLLGTDRRNHNIVVKQPNWLLPPFI